MILNTFRTSLYFVYGSNSSYLYLTLSYQCVFKISRSAPRWQFATNYWPTDWYDKYWQTCWYILSWTHLPVHEHRTLYCIQHPGHHLNIWFYVFHVSETKDEMVSHDSLSRLHKCSVGLIYTFDEHSIPHKQYLS